jgi:hypothetical protein
MFELKATRVVEKETFGRWVEGGFDSELQFRRIQHWSRGSIWLEESPDLSSYSEDEGINLYEKFEFDDWTFEDGHHEWKFPPNISEEDRKRILALDEESDLSDDGWEVVESETWFYGPLEVVSG